MLFFASISLAPKLSYQFLLQMLQVPLSASALSKRCNIYAVRILTCLLNIGEKNLVWGNDIQHSNNMLLSDYHQLNRFLSFICIGTVLSNFSITLDLTMIDVLFGKNTHGWEKVERHLINRLIVQFYLEWNNSGQWISSRNLHWRYGVKLGLKTTKFSVIFFGGPWDCWRLPISLLVAVFKLCIYLPILEYDCRYNIMEVLLFVPSGLWASVAFTWNKLIKPVQLVALCKLFISINIKKQKTNL